MIADSSLAPDFYVHPDYLVVDQVLDQIGKNIVSDWDSNCIKASKILHKTKQLTSGIEIAYLTPLQEAAMRGMLSNSKSTSKKRTSKKLTNQSTSAFLPFSEFLRKGHIGRSGTAPISAEKFYEIEKQLKERELEGKNIPHLLKEENNLGSVDNALVFCNVAFLLKDIENLPENRLSDASRFEIIFGSRDFFVNDFYHENERINLNKFLNLTKVRNSLRDALAAGILYSYIEEDGQYDSIPPNVWGDEQAWCRLLMEGFKTEVGWHNIISHESDRLKIDDIVGDLMMSKEKKKVVSQGRVFFKKAEVKAFLEKSGQALPYVDDPVNKEFWEKLFDPKKPWLKLMNEMALELSNEEIKTKLKKQLEDDIEKKAKSLGLVPSGNKVALIATFLRAPQQEKGTTYRSEEKKENPNQKKKKQKPKKE